jgi:hypothetical protein
MLATGWLEGAVASLGLAGGLILVARGIEALAVIMNPLGNPAGAFTWLPLR